MSGSRTVRRMEGGRLVYYSRQADPQFWANHWLALYSRDTFAEWGDGYFGMFSDCFLRHLPRSGRILEGGCAIGWIVSALRRRGYDCEGVEWSTDLVERVRRDFPDLPIRVGDVTRLDVPDGRYAAYISLGVVEHRREGPEPYLLEAHRVLAPGGLLLLTVPFLHPLRRLKAAFGIYRGDPGDLPFYQYAWSRREMQSFLEAAGFAVIETAAFDGMKGLRDEIPLLRRLLKSQRIGPRLWRTLDSRPWVHRVFGHVLLFVCQKCDDAAKGSHPERGRALRPHNDGVPAGTDVGCEARGSEVDERAGGDPATTEG